MRCLIIPDLQIPFEHERALMFCRQLKREYRVKDEDVYFVGDELDLQGLSSYKKNPNNRFSPASEIMEARERLKAWYSAFPIAKLCTSNHGNRVIRKAIDSEIPSVCLREYRDIIDAPKDWIWKKRWNIDANTVIEHGDDWGSPFPHHQAALWLGKNVIIGHHHTKAGIEYIQTEGRRVWGMSVSCLINFDDDAFDYARGNKQKPVLGAGLVLDGAPVYVPFT
jgi:hypothetical protein